MVTVKYFWSILIAMAMTSSLKAELIDLSHSHDASTIMAPGSPPFKPEVVFEGDYVPGVYVLLKSYSVGEHGGTHIDVPIHFKLGGRSVDQIPLEDTIADGVMIDCSKEVEKNTSYGLTVEKLLEWEEEHGEIPKDAAVVVNFNWYPRFSNASLYFNTDTLNDSSTYLAPYISEEAIDWLIDKRNIKILAQDVASPDPFYSKSFPVHVNLLPKNKIIVENANNLGRLPARGFRFYAAPVKFVGATGVQVRAFAVTYDHWGSRGAKSAVTSVWVLLAPALTFLFTTWL